MASTVALVRCPDYAATEGALAEALALLGGLGAFVPRGATVLVKPNLLAAAAPDKAVCTHPAVLRAVVRALREAGSTAQEASSAGWPMGYMRTRSTSARRASIRSVRE